MTCRPRRPFRLHPAGRSCVPRGGRRRRRALQTPRARHGLSTGMRPYPRPSVLHLRLPGLHRRRRRSRSPRQRRRRWILILRARSPLTCSTMFRRADTPPRRKRIRHSRTCMTGTRRRQSLRPALRSGVPGRAAVQVPAAAVRRAGVPARPGAEYRTKRFLPGRASCSSRCSSSFTLCSLAGRTETWRRGLWLRTVQHIPAGRQHAAGRILRGPGGNHPAGRVVYGAGQPQQRAAR